MTAAVDLAVLEELRALQAEVATLKLAIAPAVVAPAPAAVRPLSMTLAAIRQRRYRARQKAKASVTRVTQRNGTLPTDQIARANAVDLDLGSKSKEHVKSLAESDARRERRKFYCALREGIRRLCGVEYPDWAPFPDQKATKALQAEGRKLEDVLRAAVPVLKAWTPTKQFPFPTVTLIRAVLLNQEHGCDSPRREGPQPRIFHGGPPRVSSPEGPRPIQGDIASALEQLRAKAERRGAP